MADNINQTLEDLITALQKLVEAQGECKQVSGPVNEPDGSDGAVSTGPGTDFFDSDAYFTAKCNTANWIFDGVLSDATWFDDNNVDILTIGGSGVVAAWIGSQLFAGPPGWVAALTEVTIGAVVALLLAYALDFEDVTDALADQHEELVTALYNAGTANQAREAFLEILAGASPPITTPESWLVSLLLSANHLNQLFDPSEDAQTYQSDDPIDCPDPSQVWSFELSGESWTFSDDSTGSASASGSWVSAREAWELSLSPAGGVAWGRIYLDGLSIAVDVGNSVQYDFSAPSDGKNSSVDLRVIYDDASEFLTFIGNTKEAGTIVLPITEAGTIEQIDCFIGRIPSAGGDYTQDIEEVRIV